MKLKKLVLGLMLSAFLATGTCAFASDGAQIKSAIAKYKAHNYVGCLQDTQNIIKNSPSNIYAYYYQALAYVQLGKSDEAVESFNKVIELNTSRDLVEYAQLGVACINTPEECEEYAKKADDLDKFIRSGNTIHQSVQTQLNQKRLDKMKEKINEEVSNKKSEMPTNDEIANAVKTLAKAGINPMAGIAGNNMNMYQNPEMMQMNMLLGNSNQNNPMSMLPMLLMSQNQQGGKIDPQLIQTMMMSQMSPDFGMSNNTY